MSHLFSNACLINSFTGHSCCWIGLAGTCIWVRSRNCGCLVTWFCYQLIAKTGNKTAAVSWPDPYVFMIHGWKVIFVTSYMNSYSYFPGAVFLAALVPACEYWFIIFFYLNPLLSWTWTDSWKQNKTKQKKHQKIPQTSVAPRLANPGVGVTKPISSVPLFSKFFSTVKTHVSYWISHWYLAGVAAAQLRWHLSDINVIRTI